MSSHDPGTPPTSFTLSLTFQIEVAAANWTEAHAFGRRLVARATALTEQEGFCESVGAAFPNVVVNPMSLVATGVRADMRPMSERLQVLVQEQEERER